jgi:YD repeat-containing protein
VSAVRCAALAAGLVVAGRAGAAERPVAVTIERCPSLSEPALRDLMRAELGALLVTEDPGAERVRVRCDGDRARVAVDDPDQQPALERTISLAGFPADAQPRLLALVAVELLATRRPEMKRPRLTPEAAPVAVEPVSPGPVVSTHGLRVMGGGGPRLFLGTRGLTAWTGGMRLERAAGTSVGWALDVEGGGARRAVAPGEITALLVSAGATVRLRWPLGRGWAAAAGPGARLGLARLAGEAARPDDSGRAVLRPWAGPFGVLALDWGHGHLGGALALEGGYALLGARGLAGGALAAAVGGPWVGATLSGGWQR